MKFFVFGILVRGGAKKGKKKKKKIPILIVVSQCCRLSVVGWGGGRGEGR